MKYVSGRVKELKVGISSYSEDKTSLSVVGDVNVAGIISATAISISTTTGTSDFANLNVSGVSTFAGAIDANGNLDVDGHTELDNVNVSGVSTFAGIIDSNGQIVGAATSNIIPFLYSNYSLFPSATTYHGAVAHAHNTGKLYYAHAGNWIELVNKETSGTVGTGTERYNIGPVDLTTLDVSGISTFAGAIDANGNLDVDGQTDLDDVVVSGVSTFQSPLDIENSVLITGITTIGGLVDINAGGQANTFKVEDLTDNRVIIAGTGGELEDDANLTFNGTTFNVGSAITMYQATGIISATKYHGDGSSLTGIDATSLKDESGNIKIQANSSGAVHSGISTLNIVGVNSTFTANHRVILGSDANDRVTVNSKFNSDLHPSASTTYDLGNGTGYWKTLWVKNIYTNASGVSTFKGAIDADGHTELNTLNVTGVSTFTTSVTINPSGANNSTLTIKSLESSAVVGPTINLLRDDGAPQDQDYLGIIKFNGSNSAGQQIDYVKLSGKILDVTDTTEDAALEIKHYKAGSETVTAEFRSDSLQLLNGTNFSVAGTSIFTGNIDSNGGANIAGGLVADTAKISDLTNTRVVYAGTNGELQDSANLTFNGTTLNGTFSGDGTALLVTIPGISTTTTSQFTNLVVTGNTVLATAKVSDLTDNRIVIAGASGELEDTSKLTFDGSTLSIVGDATFTGNVSVAGTLTSEEKTNIDSIGIVTARTGVRINSGGLVISSGVATFTDAIDSNGGANISGGSGLVASTAKISDLTNTRVVFSGAAGELQDNSGFTFNGSTVAAPAFSGDGSALTGITAAGTGAIGGITVKDEGVTVGTAGSISTFDFKGITLSVIATAGAAGVATVTAITDPDPEFSTINVTGISTFAGDITANGHIDLPDEKNIRFGADGDLAIGHTSFHSFVSNRTNSLYISSSDHVYIKTTNVGGSYNPINGGNSAIDCKQNAEVALYYNNSKKFQTTTSGITVTGTAQATDFNSTSDIKLKTNIQAIEDPLAKVVQIEGVSFNWKEDNRPALGVIADQVEKIIPELVTDGDPKTVNYNGLIGLLIEAVKEQQVQITELKSKLDSLS